MLPDPLAPLDPHKTRSIASIYAPRRSKKKTKMISNDIAIKPSLTPFHPLPAIGKKFESRQETKVYVFDVNKNKTLRPGTVEERSAVAIHEALKPLTPLSIHSYKRTSSLEKNTKPMIRENTYDLIEPIFLNANANSGSLTWRVSTVESNEEVSAESEEPKISPKTRFKEAAQKVAKLSCVPETGKLLCLRERETFNFNNHKGLCKLEHLPQSPAHKLSKLSEIFQNLEMRGRHRDRMKKENTWF